MPLPPERIDTAQAIVYLAKHPCYKVTLTRSMPSCSAPSPEPPLVELQFTSEPHQSGTVLTLAALEQFHDALSRLLDYIKQERVQRTTLPPSGRSMADAMAPASDQTDDATASPQAADVHVKAC